MILEELLKIVARDATRTDRRDDLSRRARVSTDRRRAVAALQPQIVGRGALEPVEDIRGDDDGLRIDRCASNGAVDAFDLLAELRSTAAERDSARQDGRNEQIFHIPSFQVEVLPVAALTVGTAGLAAAAAVVALVPNFTYRPQMTVKSVPSAPTMAVT